MKDRIKEIRDALDLSQADFAAKIGVAQTTVAGYEAGARVPRNNIVMLICREFGVNEKWLRTGEGEMFSSMRSDASIAAFFADVLKDDPDSFRKRLVSMLAKLDARDWEDLTRMAKKMLEEEDLDYVLKDKTLLAMLNLQMNRYGTATDVAVQAISLADNIREERTLPSYIWALSILADPDRECTSDVIEALRVAYCHEPDNILIPIMTGSCMDRLMYRYHYGRLSIDQLSLFYRVITDSRLDEELSAASLEIFVTRCLIELKRTKQDIFIVTRDSDMMADPEVVQELKRRFDRHKSLITLLLMVFPEIERLADEFPKDSRIESAHLTELLNSYYQDLEMLEKQIRHVPR